MIGLPSSKSETPVGAIVGGVIGGIVATLGVSALFFFVYLKKRRVKYPEFGRKLEGEYLFSTCVLRICEFLKLFYIAMGCKLVVFI